MDHGSRGTEPTEHRAIGWVRRPPAERWPSPEYVLSLSLFDPIQGWVWCHFGGCACTAFLPHRTPGGECPQHGKLLNRDPGAGPNSWFIVLFERGTNELIRQPETGGEAGILGMCWDAAWGVQERAMVRVPTANPLLQHRCMERDNQRHSRRDGRREAPRCKNQTLPSSRGGA